MMINQQEPPEKEVENFATNWYNRADDIFQLMVSDYIWQTYEDESDLDVPIQRIVKDDNNGIIYDPQKEEVIGHFYYNPQESKWILYAKEKY